MPEMWPSAEGASSGAGCESVAEEGQAVVSTGGKMPLRVVNASANARVPLNRLAGIILPPISYSKMVLLMRGPANTIECKAVKSSTPRLDGASVGKDNSTSTDGEFMSHGLLDQTAQSNYRMCLLCH